MAAPVSARFKELLTGDYQISSLVEVVDRFGTTIADTATLDVVSGRVDVDANASFRRSLSDLTLVDATGDLVPTTADDWFSPVANNELRVWSGLVVDGTPELVLQGVFHLEGCETQDTPTGLTIRLSAYDRARKYSRARRITPKRFDQNAATPISTSITQLLQDAYPDTSVFHDNPPHLTAEGVLDAGGDPWEYARELAVSMGYELYFDRLGNCRLAKVPDPNNASLTVSWTYREGEDSALLAVGRRQSNEDVNNGWVITGENPANGSPVRVVVWDADVASPTYYLGPYGKVPGFHQDDKVRTVAQAEAAGRARLNNSKGATEAVTFTILPNPALEERDAVKIVRARSQFPDAGPGSEALIVDRFTVPLTALDGPMVVSCRQRRLA